MSNLKKPALYFLRELKRSYPTEEWFTATRKQIAEKTDYPLRSSDRHLGNLLEAGHLEREPGRWKIRNIL